MLLKIIEEIKSNPTNEAKKRDELISELIEWAKIKGYDFKVEDEPNYKFFNKKKGITYLVFKTGSEASEFMELMSSLPKYKKLYTLWSLNRVGIVWNTKQS